MTALLVLLLILATDPAAPATPLPVAGVYVPHPDALKPRLKGSPLQGMSLWFTPKAVRNPWLVLWPAQLPLTPQVRQAGGVAADPWVQSPPVQALLQGEPAADVVVRIDLQRALGLMAREPMGDTAAQVLRRAGLDTLQAVDVRGLFADDHTLRTHSTIAIAKPKRALADAFGPPAPCVLPAVVPPQALQWHAARILPGRVWQVWETVAGGLWALQWSLARTQLDVLEDNLNKRWMEDVLGFAPQTWVLYSLPAAHGGTDAVAVLAVQEGSSAASFVRETLAMVHELSPTASIKAAKIAGVPTWVVQGAAGRETHVAVMGNTFVVATSADALAAQLAYHGAAGAPLEGTGPSVACGLHDDGAIVRQLKAVGAMALLPKDTFKAMGKTVWWMDATDDGWHARTLSRPH